MPRSILIFLFISLISLISPIDRVSAETTACGEVEPDLGAAAAKSPSQYYEVEVPGNYGDSEASLADKAFQHLSSEINFSDYASLLVTSLSNTYQLATEKLSPPAITVPPKPVGQPSKNKVYVTACVENTDRWFEMPTQEIVGTNVDSLSLSSQVTTPSKNYLIRLPYSDTRLREVVASQNSTLAGIGSPSDPSLVRLALTPRPKIEGDLTSYNIYWDLCILPAANACSLDNFITEIEINGETRVITPGTYTSYLGSTVSWGRLGSDKCISSEQIPGLSPFKTTLGSAATLTARVIGKTMGVDCASPASQVVSSVSKSKTDETISAGFTSTSAPCPGTYTPPGQNFLSSNTCIAGSCRISPITAFVRNVAGSLWSQLTGAISDCASASSPEECLSNILVKKTVPIHVYYYPSGGNYGSNLDNLTKEGFDPGQNLLFKPPNDEYSTQGALEPATSNFGSDRLMHAVGPIKSVYTKIECQYLTPPGQENHCDKSEML